MFSIWSAENTIDPLCYCIDKEKAELVYEFMEEKMPGIFIVEPGTNPAINNFYLNAKGLEDYRLEAQLEFVQLRKHTPQWEVLFNKLIVARVTERIIASPPFILVKVLPDGVDGEELQFETRNEVVKKLIEWVK